MKTVLSLVLAIAGTVAVAVEQRPPTREEVEKMTPQERKAAIMEIALRKYGGPTTKPGTGEGTIKIVNSQKAISTKSLPEAVTGFTGRFHYSVEILDGTPVTVETATQRLSEIKANAAVYIVSEKAIPRILVSPEEGWAIVNASSLRDGAKDDAEAESRLAKEVIRALCFVGGLGQGSGMAVMRPVNYSMDLDSIQGTHVMGDAAKRFALVMPSFGLQPKVVKNYRTACQEGWAPAPTNDIQRAIWNEVRKLPEKPIKIEFDPARGK